MAGLLYLGILMAAAIWSFPANANPTPEFQPFLREVRRSSSSRAESWEEEYGYVNVRPFAHMFYWLQKTTHKDGFKNRPVVFWHQGGPGAGSSGYGNFEIIGPKDIFGTYNNDTWLQSVSIVYLDSPVGAGFSYVDHPSAYARNLQTMSDDLVAMSKVFFTEHSDLQTVPLYIFGESYGGKVAAGFAQALDKAVKAGTVKCNLKGYVMGDAWTSPMDSVNTWGPYLYEMSILDEPGLAAVEAAARKTQKACDAGEWRACTNEWRSTEYVIMRRSNYVSFYNILKYDVSSYDGLTFTDKRGKEVFSSRNDQGIDIGIAYDTMLAHYQSNNLKDYMNNEVRRKIAIIPSKVSWSSQSSYVFFYNEVDFMKDALDIVDDTLNNTNLQVIIYQGQLDLICDTTGAMRWTQRLKWPGIQKYNSATRKALTEPKDGQTDMYVKSYENFKFYWMLRAGHMVPADMGPASLRMLHRVIGDTDR